MTHLAVVQPFPFESDPDAVEELRASMARDGYFKLDVDKLPWVTDEAGESMIDSVRRGAKCLLDAGVPSSFLLAYDEPWLLAHQVKELLWMVTGNAQIFDWYFFYVDPSHPKALSAGWPPHRDRMNADASSFRGDGTPKYCTVWIALSDANPENSCLSVVPRGVDPGYLTGDGDTNPLSVIFSKPEAFQAIRALPVPAGSLICFSHRLLHWGSKPNPHSQAPPRVALSFAAASDDFEKPYLDPKYLPKPPLELRIGLVCGQILAYGMNVDPGKEAAHTYFEAFRTVVQEFNQDFVSKVAAARNWLVAKYREEEAESSDELEMGQEGLDDFMDELG